MNVIGIDYQQTLSVLTLREGRGDSAVATSIGDGRRVLVPHAVTASGTWGSDALGNAATTCYQPLDPLRDGPWLESPAAELFWQGIYTRLVGYLGRVKPTFANGYQMTIALQGADWQAARSGVQNLCAQAGAGKHDSAGLREAVCIPATEALLCRWLAAPSTFAPVRDADSDGGARRRQENEELPADAVIGVVAIGDSSTLVGAYRIQRDPAGRRQLTTRPDVLQRLATGLSAWQTRLLHEVCSRFSEDRGPENTLELRDSALDFAWQITQAADRELTWRGTGQERMYAPLFLTRAECVRWPETHLLQAALPSALARAANALGRARRIDRILVGGVGALWPFAGEIARQVAPTWTSSHPQMDVAFGAAAWREVSGNLLRPVAEPRIESVAAEAPQKRSNPPSAALPPPPVSPARLPTASSLPTPPLTPQKPTEPAASAPVPQAGPAPRESPPLPEKPQDGDNAPPVPRRAPVDGDEWNAPEPDLIPPWERE